MPIIGLSFHKLVQVQYFQSTETLPLKTEVIADLDQGQVLAKVISGPHEAAPEGAGEVVPVVLRAVGEADREQIRANDELALQAGAFWKEKVQQRSLDMKLVDVEVYYDRSKIIFYFTSNSRIDFRELVKDLVHEYRVRIEFRQIGVRHETQMTGAVGNCGRMCCCCRYLHQFAPVTIRMAKEQNIFLNPAKVSGICGRLLCCLAYEQESYEKFHSESPRQGKRYTTPKGIFKVVRTNMFYNSVTALDENNEEMKFSLDEWKALSPTRYDGQQGSPAEAHAQKPQQKDGQKDGHKDGHKDGQHPARESNAPRQSREGACNDAREPGDCKDSREPGSRRDAKSEADKKDTKRPTFVTGRMSFRQKKRQARQDAGPDQRPEQRSAQRPDQRSDQRSDQRPDRQDAARGRANPDPKDTASRKNDRAQQERALQAKAPDKEKGGKNQAHAEAGRHGQRQRGENRPQDG